MRWHKFPMTAETHPKENPSSVHTILILNDITYRCLNQRKPTQEWNTQHLLHHPDNLNSFTDIFIGLHLKIPTHAKKRIPVIEIETDKEKGK